MMLPTYPEAAEALVLHGLALYGPVQVEGRTGLAFLDTGTTACSVAPDLARDAPRHGQQTMRGAFDERNFDAVRVSIGWLDQPPRPCTALVGMPQREPPPFAVLATLDAATILAEPLVLDFRLPAVYRPEQMPRLTWQQVPAARAKGLWLVELQAPRGPAWALFDTGAALSVFHAARHEALGLSLRPAYALPVADVTQTQMQQQVVACQGLTVAESPLPGDGFIADLRPIEEALGHRVDLVLGISALLRSGLRCGLRWRFAPTTGQVFVH